MKEDVYFLDFVASKKIFAPIIQAQIDVCKRLVIDAEIDGIDFNKLKI
jgi:hypothetical protein